MPSNVTRRRYLAGIGSAATAGVAGCTGLLQNEASLQDQLDTVKEATTKYEDPKQAMEDGFKFGGPYVPGMGWHFTHPDRLQTAAEDGLDIEKPPMLTYLDNDHTDGLELAAVEYGLPKGEADSPDLFNDENADATEEWHTHEAASHVFSNANGQQDRPKDVAFESLTTKDNWAEFRPVDQDLQAGDSIALDWGKANAKEGDEKEERVVDLVANHPSLTTLHAWVHVENPAGTFRPVNSEFAGSHDH